MIKVREGFFYIEIGGMLMLESLPLINGFEYIAYTDIPENESRLLLAIPSDSNVLSLNLTPDDFNASEFLKLGTTLFAGHAKSILRIRIVENELNSEGLPLTLRIEYSDERERTFDSISILEIEDILINDFTTDLFVEEKICSRAMGEFFIRVGSSIQKRVFNRISDVERITYVLS